MVSIALCNSSNLSKRSEDSWSLLITDVSTPVLAKPITVKIAMATNISIKVKP
jgi:hypothetical protein